MSASRIWLRPHTSVLIALVVIGCAAVLHATLVHRHLTFLANLNPSATPADTPLRIARPAFTADASMWIRYSIDVLEGRQALRSHRTDADNAPQGREVHWNSGMIAWLAGLGWAWQRISGQSPAAAVEQAAIWANLPLFLTVLCTFTWWTFRRAGARAAILVAVGCFGQRWFYEGFIPSYYDHHGLASAAVTGMLLGLTFMGFGWVRLPAERPERALALLPDSEIDALRAARWSGFWGGFGLWISTATMSLPVVLVSLASLAATTACRAHLQESGARLVGATWRAWGRAAAATSIGFYLLEYFPFQLGWRLEVNHPLYALAWWAGAELLAWLLECLAPDSSRNAAAHAAVWRKALLFLPAIAAPVLVIWWRGPEVFALADPFMVRLHDSISEFKPLVFRIQMADWLDLLEIVVWKLIAPGAGVALLIATRRRTSPVLFVTLLVCSGLLLLSFAWESRWGTIAGGAELPLAVCALALALQTRFFGDSPARRRATLAGAVALLYLTPAVWLLGKQIVASQRNLVPADVALELLHRDIAGVIRRSDPLGNPIVFTSPNSSVSIGYFGRFRTLGTLYWENHAGLRAAAELNCAESDEAAEALVRRLGVTHVVMITEENFAAGYANLLHAAFDEKRLATMFGVRLLKRNIPVWLEPLPYSVPPGLPAQLASLAVDVYRVNFAQSFLDAYLRGAQLYASRGQTDVAVGLFNEAAKNSTSAVPYLAAANLLAREKRTADALAQLELGLARLPSPGQADALTDLALSLSVAGDFKSSIALYRRAVALTSENSIAANNLAWRLAVSVDDTLRDPAEALTLATDVLSHAPENPNVIDTYAAALAANGNFEAAIAQCRRAIDLAEKAHNAALAAEIRQRLDAYTARRPWRE